MTGMGQTIYERGIEQGLMEGKLEILFELVKDGTLKLAEAVARSSMSIEEFEQRMKKAGY